MEEWALNACGGGSESLSEEVGSGEVFESDGESKISEASTDELDFKNRLREEQNAERINNTQSKNIAKGSSKAKTGPKPFGTGAHNQQIAKVADSVTDGEVIAGGQRVVNSSKLPEAVIKTPNGLKSFRRPDILVRKFDGSTYGINVGKITSSGAPITREANAINDLEDAGIPMFFVPY